MTLFPKNRPEAHGAAALLLTLLISLPSISQTSFGPLAELPRSYTGIEERDYITAAFGDYNNDGFLDIAATTHQEVIVYRNNPQRPGSFTVAFRHPLGNMGRQICWADFDNDGDLDLFVNFSWTNETMFFRNSGAAGNFELVRVTHNALPQPGNPQGAGWFDANQDGKLDFFISSGSGQSKIHRNLFDGQADPLQWFDHANADQQHWVKRVYAKDGTYTTSWGDAVNGSFSLQADIDNSGRQDILYAVDQARDKNRLIVWLNRTQKGASSLDFWEVSRLVLDPPGAPTHHDMFWSGVAAWDADNDGDLDVLFAGANGSGGGPVRAQFYQNRLNSLFPREFSADNYRDLFRINESVPFGDATPRSTGGIAAGDLTNNGWQDVYLVHRGEADRLYLHNGTSGLGSTTYAPYNAANHPPVSNSRANGVTFGDIDNDGDLDMFLCNGGRIFYNTTNNNFIGGVLRPSHPRQEGYRVPDGPQARHYLDVMVSGASATEMISTKDGIGSRVYLFRMEDGEPHEPSLFFRQDRLVGMRDIDGGSGYGSQATQVQHFGLDATRLGSDPHKRQYAVKAVFTTGDTLWKFGVIPEKVEVRIPYAPGGGSGTRSDTTWLAQTIEMSLLEVWLDPISRIDIEAVPASAAIAAGDSVFFRGTVYTYDRDGIETVNAYYSSLIRWEWRSLTPGTDPARAGLTSTIDSTTAFWSTEAFTEYRIKAWLQNPQNPDDEDSAFMTVTVTAAPPYRLSIEGSPNLPATHAHKVNPQPLGTVVFTSTDASRTVYAVMRDVYGNWAGVAASASWSTTNPLIATAAHASSTERHRGIITRVAPSGSTVARATQSGMQAGEVTVILQATTFTDLRIVNASRTALASLTMSTDRDTLLLAEGRNSATGEWEPVEVDWSVGGGLLVNPSYPPPASTNNWRVYPGGSGSGTIGVALGSISASIPVTFTKGAPRRMFLYRLATAPDVGGNDSLRSGTVYEMTAGETFPLFAKLFDANHEWLNAYQSDPALAAGITWQVTDADGNTYPGYLNRTSGSSVDFAPTQAHRVYRVHATFTAGATTLSATAQIHVGAAAPSQLAIERSYQRLSSPNTPAPWSPIEIDRNSTHEFVYAVLRDRFGNWYAPSPATAWSAADTIIMTGSGNTSWGQGVVTRNANAGTTTLRATDNGTGLTTTATVILRDITYDSLRIVVQSGAQRVDIDSLVMRTDRDTTLLALGMRSDDSTWEAVTVQWSASGVDFSPPPPHAPSWRLSPLHPGTGTVTIRLGEASDQITVRALPGLPRRLRIFEFAGDPAGRSPYPDTPFTVVAGDTMNLFAKIFDHNGVWLPPYETADSLRMRITWTDNASGTGTFSLRDGHRARFVPVRAQSLVTLTSLYTSPDTSFSSRIVFRIIAGPAAQLVLEASAAGDPNTAQPIGMVTITGTDTTRYVHAILRDRFGNYVAPSNPTSWGSRNPAIVTATVRQAVTGEGVIRRGELREGNTYVVAIDVATDLRDSVRVVVQPYDITALRVVVDADNDSGFIPITSLTMRTDQDTTLRVIGQRSDNNQWIPVNAAWSALSQGGTPLAITPSAPGNSDSWTGLSPARPDTGTMTVTLGSRTATISAAFGPGLPNRVVLYPSEGPPQAGQEYGTQMSAPAGTQIPFVAKVFDRDGYWLSSFEISSAQNDPRFVWETLSLTGAVDTTTGSLSGRGYRVTYLPTVAFRDVVLRVSFTAPGQTRSFSDEIRIQTVAGPAYRIVLEANPVPTSMTRNDPLDTLTITADQSTGHLFAIIRDRYGNYVTNSQSTSWATANNLVATAAPGFQVTGEGIIARTGSGTTTVTATNLDIVGLNIKSATAVVRVVDYYYVRLRIMIGDAVPARLVMSTNQDTTVRVQGLRSDTTDVWEDVAANWELLNGLRAEPAAPRGISWRFSPTSFGEGGIRAWLDNQLTIPDTLPVEFTIGEPLRVTFTILTPPDSLIAGEPIRAEVRIYNRDGLVPLETCYTGTQGAVYNDVLPDGGRPLPSVVTGLDSTALNTSGTLSTATNQCFAHGIDTVTFRLYYAPADPDSLHTLTVNLGALTASSASFALLPGALDSVALRTGGMYLPADTTIVLRSPDGVVVLYSIGFDRYGNLRGEEITRWEVTGTLYDPGTTPPRSRMYYDASNAFDAQEGYIVSRGDNHAADSVRLRILGPDVPLEYAVMRDRDGDGYLDAIEIVFAKPVLLTDSLLQLITVRGEGYTWVIDSVTSASGDPLDSAFTLHLNPIRTDVAQTDWSLFITIDAAFEGVVAIDLPVIDGAGPVIWRVIKTLRASDSRALDEVTVIFSEPIIDMSGANIGIGLSPRELFEVYEYNPVTGEFIRVPDIFDGIAEMIRTSGDTAVTFIMSNAKDLLSRHYLRIDSSAGLITDRNAYNKPNLDNQKVRVVTIGTPPESVIPYPNPALPDFRYVTAGEFRMEHDPGARRYIKNGGHGTVLTFKLPLPTSRAGSSGRRERVRVVAKIYDIAGNLVHTSQTPDILESLIRTNAGDLDNASVVDVDLYWNGSNQQGMPVAPGLYRCIIFIDYEGSAQNDARFVVPIGISR